MLWGYVLISIAHAINFHNARQSDHVNVVDVLQGTGISVRYQPLFDDIVLSERFLSLHATEVDLVSVDVVWKGALNLLPLNAYGLSNPADNALFSLGNDTLALPWDPNLGVLLYNKRLIEKYNLSKPTTWEDMEISMQKVMQDAPEVEGFVFSGADETFNCFMFELIRSHEGGEFVDLEAKEVTIFNENAIAAITRLYDWFLKDRVPWSVFALSNAGVVEYINTVDVDVLFARVWINEVCLNDLIDLNKWGVVSLPGGFATRGGFGIGIDKNTSHVNESVIVLRYLDQTVKNRPSCLTTKNVSMEELNLTALNRFYGTLNGELFASCAKLIQTSLQAIFPDKHVNISSTLLRLKCDLVRILKYETPLECVSTVILTQDRFLRADDLLEGLYWSLGGLVLVGILGFGLSKLPQFGQCFIDKYTLVGVGIAIELIDLIVDSVNSWDVATNDKLQEFHVPFISVLLMSAVVSLYRIYSNISRLRLLCSVARDDHFVAREEMFRRKDAFNTILSLLVEDIPFVVLNFMTQLDVNSGPKQTMALVWNSFLIGIKAMHFRLFFQLAQKEQSFVRHGYSMSLMN